MRKVLVTGGGGFIGNYVCTALQARGDSPVLYDHPLDVCDRNELFMATREVDGIINLAGVLGTEETIGAEAEAVKVNILGALNVYDCARRWDIPVVQIGTGHKGQLNPYAISKGAAEDLGLTRALYRDEHIATVRAFHAYGPGQKVCPPHGTARVRKIMPSFICRALTGMDIEINGTGKQLVDLIHVALVAQDLVDALDGPYGYLVEAGTGQATSVLDAAHDVLSATGSKSRIVHLPMRPGEPEQARVVATRTNGLRHPAWPYRLDETIDYYRGLLAA
jgi:UDP-glucose 4-epimerase